MSLKEQFEKETGTRYNLNDVYDQWNEKYFDEYVDYLEEYNSWLENKLNNQWVSVKDRLPEEFGKYIVISSFVKKYPISLQTSYFYLDKGFQVPSITHWMPLLPPPKG